MQGTAEAFGQQFSVLTIGYTARLDKINTLINAAYEVQAAIQQENIAETLATENPALTAEGAWDTFRGNGVSPSPTGINVNVQTKAAALFTAMDAI
jgi:hypothetical protein